MGRWMRSGPGVLSTPARMPQNSDGLIEPTADEAKNGWTAETLTKYLQERAQAQTLTALHRPPAKPTRANSKYSPHRWRG